MNKILCVSKDGAVAAMTECTDSIADTEYLHALANTGNNSTGFETQESVRDIAH